jgi:hypothetical protein
MLRRGVCAALLGLLGVGSGLALGSATAVVLSAAGHEARAGASTATGPENDHSYAIVDAAGGVLTFGGAGYDGDTLGLSLQKPIVGAAADPNGGYWLVAADGGIFTFGGAQFFGSVPGRLKPGQVLNQPIVGMAATADGGGYWLVAADGGIFTFGDAAYYGSVPGRLKPGQVLNKPIVGIAAAPGGGGYWVVASDGGIFTFGNVGFYGSVPGVLKPGQVLNKPIVGMAAAPGGGGYWVVASDGGIFTFGDAVFHGSMGGSTLNAPIVGMAATPDNGGYWLVGQDAGVFTFGDAAFAGSAQSPLHPPLFPAGFSQAIPPVVTIMPDAAGPQATHQGRLRVAFAGDSLGFFEGQYTADSYPSYQIDIGAAPGCGFTNGAPINPWSDPGTVYLSPTACSLWAEQLEWLTARFHPDVTVIQLGYWEAQFRIYQGRYQSLSDSAYSSFILANLEQAVQIVHSYGGVVIFNTSPYFADGTPDYLVSDFNLLVQNVVNQNPSFVTLFDVNKLLDPNGVYTADVNGVVARTPDGVHVTEAGVQDILDPPLNQMIESVGQPVFQGNS